MREGLHNVKRAERGSDACGELFVDCNAEPDGFLYEALLLGAITPSHSLPEQKRYWTVEEVFRP